MVTCGFTEGGHSILIYVLMLSLGVSRRAGRMCKTNENTHNINACGIGMYNVFEARPFGGVGDLLFTMNLAQQTCQVLLRVEVEIVIYFESERCGDLRTRFGFRMFGGCFVIRNCPI